MLDRDSFAYALENTRTHLDPRGVIETFGQTSFEFTVVSELMDHVGRVRLRNGTILAERPRLLAPEHMARVLLDGFGDRAREFADWLETQESQFHFLRYGFRFSRSSVREQVVEGRLEEIIHRAVEAARASAGVRQAVLESVDDAWEVSLLKLAVDTARRSSPGNVEEWQRRGLL